MTEIEERRRRQTLRALITEAFMFIVIVVLVIVLALITMGYQINFEKGVEHSGLVQIGSIPGGAAITVDGEGIFLPTSQSRTMTSGDHEILLTRDGYRSWRKTIRVTEGMMYRLNYPRLYKEDREGGQIFLTKNQPEPSIERSFVSRDRKTLLLIVSTNNKPSLLTINLNNPDSSPRSLDLSLALPDFDLAGFNIADWSENSSRFIATIKKDNKTTYYLIDLKSPEDSLNLTSKFGLDFEQVRFGSGDKILTLSQGTLREITVSSQELSDALLDSVTSFTNLGSRILYLGDYSMIETQASKKTKEEAPAPAKEPSLVHGIFIYEIGEDSPILVQKIKEGSPVLLALSSYYGEDHLAFVSDNKFQIYSGSFPNYGESLESKMQPRFNDDISFTPTSLTIHGEGELIAATTATNAAVYDAEWYGVTEFQTPSAFNWLSEHDIAVLQDNQLIAYDFDFTNPFILAEKTHSSLSPVISENNRYLYYFTSDAKLIKENIR